MFKKCVTKNNGVVFTMQFLGGVGWGKNDDLPFGIGLIQCTLKNQTSQSVTVHLTVL